MSGTGLVGPGRQPGLALRCLPTDWGMPTDHLVEAAFSSQEQMISAQLGLLQACEAACPFQRPQRGSTTERMLGYAYASGIAQLALLGGALEQV